ncbi:MAG: c-type cytochrome [Anaerolineae bacterium]|nr:c-type cytochrome [Anaerolineae bacterium]
MAQMTERKQYSRFTPAQRFEHIVLLVSFTGLALTGLPQKFSAEAWAQSMITALGGIESVRIIHRFLATLLMAEAIYHGGVITYKLFVLGQRATMIPTLRDLWDLRDWILFNLGLKAEHPHLPRFNFGEKAEYLAVVWGTLVMVLTGFMLWNPIATTRFLPGEAIPSARAAHGGEALLAVLAIVIWHMYNVHLKRFNRSMFTGKISREAMEEEHAEELEAIEEGRKPVVFPQEVVVKNRLYFWPFALVISTFLVAGLIWFITFEQTAITTVPRQDVVVYAPQVTPASADPAVGAALWPTIRCARCHGDDASGGSGVPALRGLTMNFDDFYQIVRSGRDQMPAIGREEIPDGYLLHLWAWLQSLQPKS